MKTEKIEFIVLLEKEVQYIVPLFQRCYCWTKEQWAVLWDDLMSLCEKPDTKHFIGSVVVFPPKNLCSNHTTSVSNKLILVDGQQRLITFLILLVLLRDELKEQKKNDDSQKLAEKIQDLLCNRHQEGSLDYYKLVPTERDKKVFFDIMAKEEKKDKDNKSHEIQNNENYEDQDEDNENNETKTNEVHEDNATSPDHEVPDNVSKCYAYFRSMLNKKYRENPPSYNGDILYLLYTAILKNLLCIYITLEESADDPYLIFETLNSKGSQLTPADLSRNYLLMPFPDTPEPPESSSLQKEIYRQYWRPIQNRFPESDELTEYIRHYLMLRQHTWIKQRDIYSTLKEILNKLLTKNNAHFDKKLEQKIHRDVLQQLEYFSRFYQKLTKPSKEEHLLIRFWLDRIQRLDVTTIYPLLLSCYDVYTRQKITPEEFCQILQILENYIIRCFICGVPGTRFTKIFPTLYHNLEHATSSSTTSPEKDLEPATSSSTTFLEKKLEHAELVHAVAQKLSQYHYPDDQEFCKKFIEANFYSKNVVLKNTKILFVLRCIEESYPNSGIRSTNAIVVYYIMPSESKNIRVNTLGNLTLLEKPVLDRISKLPKDLDRISKLPKDLDRISKLPKDLDKKLEWDRKKMILAQSCFSLNQYFRRINSWNDKAIETRSNSLATVALTIWPNITTTNPARHLYDFMTTKTVCSVISENTNIVYPFESYDLSSFKPQRLIIQKQAFPVKYWRDILEITVNTIMSNDYDAFLALTATYPQHITSDARSLRSFRRLNNEYFVNTHFSSQVIYKFCCDILECVNLSAEDWYVEGEYI